ncbi:MAG: zf-TFIIB domain-containing protein [Dehalococcoidia bacterium]|nr:zf-TFIIB domain-containing protein [Dehalococcoidia bacterium]
MKCPRCNIALKLEKYRGVEVDKCSGCEGMWLDHPELGELEDKVFDEGLVKGTMRFTSNSGDLLCPTCGKHMHWFRYRHYNLELDFCEEEHGFWLDKGEERRVLEIMEQRGKDLKRSASAEVEWNKFLSNINSKSFLDKVKDLFRG